MKKPSLLGLYARPSQIFVKGNGLNLIDTLGKSYLDFTAGIAVNALGHNDPNVVKIISEQAGKLIHLSNLYHNEYQEGLADMIVDSLGKTSFGDDARVFFCNSGTEANEGYKRLTKVLSNSQENFQKVTFQTKISLASFHLPVGFMVEQWALYRLLPILNIRILIFR